MRAKVFVLFLILSSLLTIYFLTYAQEPPEVSERGKEVYEESCAHCHGTEGRGDGSAAENLLPRPRDFTGGVYKIRSTESGQLPTDQDLFDIISNGMPGSSMPEWKSALSANDRWELVAYIKTFYSGFQELKDSETTPRLINLTGKVKYSQKSVEIGKGLYTDLGCIECHGNVGRGDGTSAPTLVDVWDFRTWPANLTQGWTFRGGSSTEDIFKRFIGGIAGSPMPAFEGDTFYHFGLTPEESKNFALLEKKVDDGEEFTEEDQEEYDKLYEKWDNTVLAALDRAEGTELTPEAQKIYDDAMKDVFEKSWHLANYVKSLSPEERPESAIGKNVLRSQFIQGTLPEMDDAAWETLESSYYPLVGQVIVEPRQFNPTIDAVNVSSFYNDTEVAFLFTWDDRTNNTAVEDSDDFGTSYIDGLAIQFPVKVPKGPTDEKPYFLWGGKKPVYLWQWMASEPDSIKELTAKGIDKAEPQEDQGDVHAKSDYKDGRYKLWVKRALKTEDKKDLQIESAVFVPIAFSAWDGANGDIDTKRVISSWYTFVLEPVPSSRRFIYPPIVALLSLGLLVGLRQFLQRKNT